MHKSRRRNKPDFFSRRLRFCRRTPKVEGTRSHIFTFRDGLICKFEAYIDIAMLNSALRMLGLRVTS